MFLLSLLEIWGFMFCVSEQCFPITLPLVFVSMGWYCVRFKWGPHSSWCFHGWSHLHIFSFMNCHFLESSHIDCGLSKGWAILRSTPWWYFPNVIAIFRCLHQEVHDFFINVSTWYGQPNVTMAFFYWFCIHFLSRKVLVTLQKEFMSLSYWSNLLSFLLISLLDLLHIISESFRS
jgi:hypothetical protein